MMTKDEVTEALSLYLSDAGYCILKRERGRARGADIIARSPASKGRLFVSSGGLIGDEGAKQRQEAARIESQVLECMTRSICSAFRMRKEERFAPGDRIALAFPDAPTCRKYLIVQKSVLDSLSVKIFIVGKDGEVAML